MPSFHSHFAIEATAPPANDADARERLLEAALTLFGEKGFGETSVRDLAVAAKVNLAAVNYYFGSKENLRIEALRHGFASTVPVANQLTAIYERARLKGTAAAAEEALRQYVHLFLQQVMSGDYRYWNMVIREQLTPGPAFEMVMKDYLEPLGRGLAGIVRLLLPDVPESEIGPCVRSIIGQCVHLRYSLGIQRYFRRDAGYVDDTALIESSWKHVAEFSIHALRGMKAAHKRQGRRSAPISRRLKKKER